MTNPNYSVIYFNGTAIASPTEIKYINPQPFGIDGRGVERMKPYYEMEYYWNYMTYTEFQTLYRLWLGHSNSGAASITVPPHYASEEYDYRTISGVFIDQPRIGGPEIQNYRADIRMKVRKVYVGG
jgi:hypothetical protein